MRTMRSKSLPEKTSFSRYFLTCSIMFQSGYESHERPAWLLPATKLTIRTIVNLFGPFSGCRDLNLDRKSINFAQCANICNRTAITWIFPSEFMTSSVATCGWRRRKLSIECTWCSTDSRSMWSCSCTHRHGRWRSGAKCTNGGYNHRSSMWLQCLWLPHWRRR